MTIPDKTKKIQQENFPSYSKMREWLGTNGFKNKGYVLEEPWKDFFVEKWEKDGLVALSMNILYVSSFDALPLRIVENPYQVDIAQA